MQVAIENLRRWLTTLAVAFAAFSATAQQVMLDVQPRTMRLNETAVMKLSFVDVPMPQAPALPEIPGFQVHFVGQETQFQMINGRQQHRLSYNFRLQPLATGQFRLGPFTLTVNGQNFDLEPVMVEVLPPANAAGGDGQATIDELVFARLNLPRTELYLQERFDVELSLYYRGVQLDRTIQLQNLPSTGLNLDEFQELGGSRENINGELYDVRRFRMRATAMTAGTFTLDPMVRVHVLVRREQSRDPFGFDAFFGRYEAQPLVVPAEPLAVNIRPLPADGRPGNFSGAVGQFTMDLQVQPTEVTVGDPITLTVTITGRGNLETIAMPAIELGDDFRRYDPKLIASGPQQKVFEQVVLPRTDQLSAVPPVTFTYFDPQQAAYQTIVRGPFPLLVKTGGATQPHLFQTPTVASSSIRQPLGIDIIGPKRAPESWTPVIEPGRATAWPSPLHLAPVAALMVALAVQRRRDALDRDVSRRRRALAPRSARAAIREAEAALAASDPHAFYAALWRAFADYTAHRANLEAGEVSPELILRTFAPALPTGDRDELGVLLAVCDETRFAARSSDHPDAARLKRHLQRTQEWLRAFERISVSCV
ncbi:MAG TPA: BatD family protein [Kiritimatiellia bacterium]|nr:BatD family protein [Kiritimatiellia bacterium]HMP32731.1 BatD family protein [Kiritimatiellia bacterium]